MKKSMILVGMLSIGYANAQEGNVGINTDNPKATLEVLPSAKNLAGTTNEGIVAPKLSKVRIASIADTNLVEGTLVYATDATYTGNNTKVAKITEKGYYFYNGTEWVKASADVVHQLWAQRDNAGITETYLKTADEKGDIIRYQNNRLLYSNLGGLDFSKHTFNDNSPLQFIDRVPNLTATSSDILPIDGISNTLPEDSYFFNYNIAQITNKHVSQTARTGKKAYAQGEYRLFTDDTVTGNISSLRGLIGSVSTFSNIKTNFATGVNGIAELGKLDGSSRAEAGYLVGIQGIGKSNANTIVDTILGGDFYVSPYKSKNKTIIGANMFATTGDKSLYDNLDGGIYPTTEINKIVGSNSTVRTLTNSNVNYLYGSTNHLDILDNSKIQAGFGIDIVQTIGSNSIIKNLSGYNVYLDAKGTVDMDSYGAFKFFKSPNIPVEFKPKNMYGLWLSDINNGSESNYAIHTGAGKVRVGDLADNGKGDRVVYADENGVLKTRASIASNNGVQNETGMTCTAANAGKINYTIIQKDGKDVGVFGFCMQNGTDYVWAYMLGGSNIYGTSANNATFGQGL